MNEYIKYRIEAFKNAHKAKI